MADMEHLFREQEMREQEMATGRPAVTERFKTALYRAEKAQYNMRKKIDKAEAEEIVIYRGLSTDLRKPGSFTICRKNAPEECAGCTTDVDAPRDVRVIGKSEGGAETMIRKFFKWMNSPEDLPGLVLRMFIAILLTAALAFTFAWLAFLTLLSL